MRFSSIFTLISVLFAGPYGFIRSQSLFKASEGENFTVTCLVYYFGKTQIFCKIDCDKEENILVQSAGSSQQNGRYSIQYKRVSSNIYDMSVSITDVHRSDAGLYKCGLEYGQRNSNMVEFQIEVSFEELLSYSFITASEYQSTHPTTSTPSDHLGPQTPPTTRRQTHLLWLLLVPVVMVMVSVLLIMVRRKKSVEQDDKTKVNPREDDEKYENERDAAVKECADCTYQSLCVDNMDPNQIYTST
ncbi:uncharacterized protein LOC129409801 isoform X2 [Boleophthalmus pectinirostris]|uniref:uncharacterized protein LOC129409801 isoform X2 n=1 Tax=Boleophthalmus pectinirostris TaxID=150288 RepID=UPI00242FEF3B|nr:uncharacterized protein LOC129409801 isoform X2 [Boleophthalmus pectinirostris]